MRIIECYVENFGRISGQKFDFKDGLNCIKSDNGSGKTTLAAFIKVMLYGMSDTKKLSLDENDRKHYLPWRGGTCGGTLTFSARGKTYRIERTFAAKAADDSFTLYDTTLGRVSTDYSASLGEELFGIDADGFERTVFLSERALTPKSDNKSISAKLSDLVGCDGDIGGMDEAVKALEDARRFYYKKGGYGELAETAAKINDITRRLQALDETEAALEDANKRMIELSKGTEEAKERAKVLMKERESATIRAAEANHEKLYSGMKLMLEESIRKRTAVAEVFGATIPTFAEIDEAGYKSIEAKNLISDVEETAENREFALLSAKFDGKLEQSQAENAAAALTALKAHKEKSNDPGVVRAKHVFANRVPDEREIDEAEALIGSKSKPGAGAIITAVIGAIAITVGIIVSELLISVLGIAALAAAAIIFAVTDRNEKRKKRDKINLFINSVSGAVPNDPEEARERLAEMKALINAAKDMTSDREAQRYLQVLMSVTEGFPETYGRDVAEAAEELINQYRRYASLAVGQRYAMGERTAKLQKAQRLRAEADAFVARFRTKSADPINELRAALTEYQRLTADIVARRDEMANLQSKHAIGESNQSKAIREIEDVDRRRQELDGEIAELGRQYTLAERQYKSCMEELEMRDELTMRRDELEDALEKHKDNYETVLLTKKYLTIAKDNMTSRYLGKTKESFIKYAEAVGGISGESFEMDTDFGVTKQEGASTKSVEAYSRGTRDLFNLAARLALVDSLYDKEKPFIILDDPFTAFDDKKTAAALKLLRGFAKDRQIIYFTCSSSRST